MAFRRVSRGTRRKLVWARSSAPLVGLAQGAPFVPFRDDLLNDLKVQLAVTGLLGLTVMRIRGIIGADFSAGTGTLVWGVKVVDSTADFTGAAIAQDGPVTSPHNDWMMYEPLFGARFAGTDTHARVVDVRSRRKIDELDQTLAIYAQTDNASAGTVTIGYQLSVLLALP